LSLSLLLDLPDRVKIGMVILQGGVVGAVMPAATAYLWEAVGRGTDESRRGLAMGMAFGGGPLLAVIGSMCQSALLGGRFFFWEFPGAAYPWNFVILFGAGVPMMLLGIVFGQLLIIPPEEREPQRQPVSQVFGALIGVPAMAMFFFWMYLAELDRPMIIDTAQAAGLFRSQSPGSGTLMEIPSHFLRLLGFISLSVSMVALAYHFRAILNQRILLLATLVTLLVYCGNMIPPNMNLYSTEALGDVPARYAGVQNTLRFSFKMVTGIFLGWLLTKTNPRAGILVTSLIFLASQIWAIFVTGPLYLIAFGLFGAGELVGAYAPNYLVFASRKEDLRKTTAFMTMLMAPAAPVGYLYGSIVDIAKKNEWTAFGMNSATLGFRLSFAVCAMFILSGIVLALVALPKHPRGE
jgi:MFS family permease